MHDEAFHSNATHLKPQMIATARDWGPTVNGLRLRRKESGPPGLGKCGDPLQTGHTLGARRAPGIDRDQNGHVVVATGGVGGNSHA
ncbi:MAG: hypothetical protein ABIR55_21770 [Burkholderiaceae bacterium]